MTEVVAALLWDGNGRFLICQRPAHKARGLLWEFVGGKVEPGETPEEALIRECREELDIVVRPGSVFMEVEIAAGTPRRLEHNDLRWIRVEEIGGYTFCPADEVILERLKAVYGGETEAGKK